ncbi:MAG: response regulator transcription factor [Actinomycetota bacterium]|nr:response regulator transcription factor [Actinomycetota bacterium]
MKNQKGSGVNVRFSPSGRYRPSLGRPGGFARQGPLNPRRSGSAVSVVSERVISVVIVDDHALVREGTRQLLQQDPGIDIIGVASSGEEALEVLARLSPEVALVDVNLPHMSGLELARRIDATWPDVHVLIVSAYDDYAYIVEALDIGVDGYLLKTASTKELIDAVHAVAEGVLVLDRQVSKRLVQRQRREPETAGPLTPRETDVLSLLAQGQSNKQIAAQLALGTRTVEGYVSNILSKLGVTSRTEAVTHAIGLRLVKSQSNEHDTTEA